MTPDPAILVFDIGKTNKKMLVFDAAYQVLHEEVTRFEETYDEDGFPCEDLGAVGAWVTAMFRKAVDDKRFRIRAVNISAYGASLVCLDSKKQVVAPLYNYLKPMPENLKDRFYETYGRETLCMATASPPLGSLNSGLQLYRLKYANPAVFQKIRYVLHLPQYFAFLISGNLSAELTSIGCHTALWDFQRNGYHSWVGKERLEHLFPPMVSPAFSTPVTGTNIVAGPGIHDSSAALIPYLRSFHDPFVLISTGTWSISLNPFDQSALTWDQLQKDCLTYISPDGRNIKASRMLAGYEFERRMMPHAGKMSVPATTAALDATGSHVAGAIAAPEESSDPHDEAYAQLMIDLVTRQLISTRQIRGDVRRILVDGGFSRNGLFMNLLAAGFPDSTVFAASVPRASALGAALAIHSQWNDTPVPQNLIELVHYPDLTK